MIDEQKDKPNEFSYLMVFAIWPAILIVVGIAAWMAIAYLMEKDEFEGHDTRGDDVLETGMLVKPAEDWHAIIVFDSAKHENLLSEPSSFRS